MATFPINAVPFKRLQDISEMKCLGVLLLLGTAAYLDAASLPSTFKKCDYSKPEALKPCLITNVEDAIHQMTKPIPEVGLPSLEPLELKYYEVGVGKKDVAVEQKYSNIKVTGYSKVQVKDIALDAEKKILVLDLLFPHLEIKGDYDLKGNVLGKPVEGKGFNILTLENVKAKQTFHHEETLNKDNQKKYTKVIKSELTLDPESGHFDYQNLFNGDKVKGDEINKIINDNFKAVFTNGKGGLEAAYAEANKNLANGLLEKVSLSEIFDNYKI